MAYSFQQRLRRVGKRMKENNPRPITVLRGSAGDTVDLVASPILMDASVLTEVALTRVEHQDWAIDAADYNLAVSGVTLPRVEDKFTDLATGEVFRVVSLNGEDPPYRFTTSERKRFIVTTQRIKR